MEPPIVIFVLRMEPLALKCFPVTVKIVLAVISEGTTLSISGDTNMRRKVGNGSNERSSQTNESTTFV